MKTIHIVGKRNKEQLLDGIDPKKLVRSCVRYEEPPHKFQVSLVNKYYLGQGDVMEKYVKREIAQKISGYKSQDVRKELFDEGHLITATSVVEKLVVSKLRCNYCGGVVKVLFTCVRDKQQWTLDRVDNDMGHSTDNTVICCLKCNLERRVLDSEKFTFTKQMRIKKTE
jgi:hypothetical protein